MRLESPQCVIKRMLTQTLQISLSSFLTDDAGGVGLVDADASSVVLSQISDVLPSGTDGHT